MTGRGRGRGALARWEASKSVGENTTRVGSPISTAVFPLSPKESWEDEIKKIQEDTTRDDRIVRVTHIIDVENFWAQIGSFNELKQFDTYMTALNSWCNEQEHSGVQQAPVHGQPVCVRHTETSQWRRAQIARLSNNMVDVIYLDYGQSECVPLNKLCSSTPGDIMSRRPMAQYVNLEGVHPVGEHWSTQANKRFRELVSSSNKLRMHFSDGIRGKLYIRDSNGRESSVGDILISEGLAQGSVDGGGSGSWGKESSCKDKLFQSEEPNSLDQQWESLAFHPTPSQQPSWITNSTSTTDQLNMKRNALSGSLLSSKEQSLQGGSSYFENAVDLKQDSNDISLNNVPVPPSPDMFAQSKESDHLETFNLKRADYGPVEALRMARPHLASPNEFLSHSKGQDSGISSVPKAEMPSKYQPPHVRNARTKTSNTAIMNSEPKLDKYSSLPQSNSNSLLQHHDQQHPPFSNFAFSPKIGRIHIAAQFQTKQAKTEDQSLNSQPLQKQTLQFQQPEFLKQQPLNENTRDKTIKAELDWKIWKFQRNVKKVLDRMVEDSSKDYSHDFEKIITDSRLSQDFQGISEVSVILQLLLEQMMDGNKYGSVAVSVCTMFRDMCIPDFGDFLNKEVTQCQDDLMEQCSATDCLERCKKFSSFLGKLYLEVLGDNDSSGCKFSVDGLIASSLHNWLSFDQADSVLIHKLNATCLKSFLMVTGPTIDLTEGNEISRYFGTIRDLVLSQDLAVPVKSTLLDILLLRASGWKVEEDSDEQETGNEFTKGEVFIEDDMTEEQQPEGTEENDEDEEWDPYSKVKSMLKNLKLQDLLPKCFDNCIRDSLLTAEWEELKRTLQEAGFPPGVILEIRMYLDKGLLETGNEKTSKPKSEKAPTTTANHTHEPKRATKSPSPTKSLERNVEIRKLNQELQQLIITGTQDPGGPRRVSPTRQISPPKEQPGHDGTPYSRGGPRKFVSRAERRHSAEYFQEDSDDTVADPLSDVSERMAPIPAASIEPSNISTSVATRPEPIKSVGTMSYSAVLKNLTSETTKPKNAPAGGKPANQSKIFSRPPPGFSPLPTHGGDTEMRMTVLSTKSKTKQTAAASGAPRNNPTRADVSMNWRNDEQSTQSSTQHQQQQHRANNSAQSGQADKWQRSDESSQSKPHRTASLREGGRGRDTPTKPTDYSSSDDSSEPPTAPVQPHRVFGPGGLKACVICGSKDHLRCNDRSKLFFD